MSNGIPHEPVELNIALRTTTGLNSREVWQARHRRVQRERASVAGHLVTKARHSQDGLQRHLRGGALVVTLTRVSPSPRPADTDNAIAGLKAVRDQLAAWLGVDDGDPRLTWVYAQARGPWAVLVRIEPKSLSAQEDASMRGAP